MKIEKALAALEGRAVEVRREIKSLRLPRAVVSWVFGESWEPHELFDDEFTDALDSLRSVRKTLDTIHLWLPKGVRCHVKLSASFLVFQVRPGRRKFEAERCAKLNACEDLCDESLNPVVMVGNTSAFEAAYSDAVGGNEGMEALLTMIDEGVVKAWPTVEEAGRYVAERLEEASDEDGED